MAQTAIGRCFIRLFGKRSKHCRTLLSSSCPAAHNFRREFDTAAADHSDAAYRLFVRETIQFLALQLEQTFPDTPILPALGNDDLYCGNYQLQPQGPFLADTLPILRALVGTLVSLGFDRNWMSYGNYSAAVHGLRIIFLSTVFFSANYRNGCGPAGDADPGAATLAWLETELAPAERGQQRVWLVYHIPPGVGRLRDSTQRVLSGYHCSNVEANLRRALLRADAKIFGHCCRQLCRSFSHG
jgi:sphingomyelin phosphodiesterase acid-like 3